MVSELTLGGENELLPLAVEIVLAIILFGLAMLALMILSAIIGFLPAIIVAVIIWLLTRSLLYAAIAFVVVAFLWAIVKRK